MEGKQDGSAQESRDFLDSTIASVAFWILPAVALVISFSIHVNRTTQSIVWLVALLAMAAGCIANAVRCGRVHCYLTGPFFLIMAVVGFSYGFGILPLGKAQWGTLILALVVGGLVLRYVPEALAGRYWRGSGASGPRADL